MTILAALLIFITVSCFVAGQILLKHAMDITARPVYSRAPGHAGFRRRDRRFRRQFFHQYQPAPAFRSELLFPFQGLSVILIAFAGSYLLKEKLTLRLTIGSIIISLGVLLVSLS